MAPNSLTKIIKTEDGMSVCNIINNSESTNNSNIRNNKTKSTEFNLNKDVHLVKSDNDRKFNLENYEKINFHSEIRWLDLIVQILLHVGCLYGFYLALTSAKILTTLFAVAIIYTSGFGITAGAHRLWSHRAYKAKWPLRLILVLLFTVTGQRDVYTWALDHRIHHKFSETVADPHDVRRGFFFSHVGWLVLTPHPAVAYQRTVIDVEDLKVDPIVMWQKKFYPPLFLMLNVALPTVIPVWYFNESWLNSFVICFVSRFTVNLNIAFCVNSVAHLWGNKPYDKKIHSVENKFVSVAALGEGWHNYHHVFPWDYKTSELGNYTLNLTTAFIDFFAKFGWAYARKSVSVEMIAHRLAKNGVTYTEPHLIQKNHTWNVDDKDVSEKCILKQGVTVEEDK